MIEIPESIIIAKQLNETVQGKKILEAEAAGPGKRKNCWKHIIVKRIWMSLGC